MATRFGTVTIKDALVTLLGTTNVSDLNSGLTTTVKQVVTKKPDDIVIEVTMFPTVCVWMGNYLADFRGASKRKEVRATAEIHFWTRDMRSIDNSIDEAQNLADNIMYIIDGNVGTVVTNGWIKSSGVQYEYRTSESGFVTHGIVSVDVVRELD
jgi:hypothetical protein